jgi:hypothetical protein
MRKVYGLHDGSGEIRYVGVTQNALWERRSHHRKSARKGRPAHRDEWIRSVFAAEGDIVIVLLEQGDWTKSESWDRERAWIAKLRDEGCDLTNMTDGGGGTQGLPADLRQQISIKAGDTLRGRKKDPAVGAAISRGLKQHYRDHPEAREQNSLRQRGRVVSDEARAKLSAARRGRPLSQAHRDAIAASSRGKTLSEETKRKISESHRGVRQNAVTRKKISEWIEANRQRCTECGYESTASCVARHQNKTGHVGRESISAQP